MVLTPFVHLASATFLSTAAHTWVRSCSLICRLILLPGSTYLLEPIKPFVFFDYAYGVSRRPGGGDDLDAQIKGYGLGLRATMPGRFNLNMIFAKTSIGDLRQRLFHCGRRVTCVLGFVVSGALTAHEITQTKTSCYRTEREEPSSNRCCL